MPNGRFFKTFPLLAAVAAASASGVMIGAGPAQALPPAPLAPGDCQQWGWPGEVVFLDPNGAVSLRFNSTGPAASGPAEWINNLGATVPGRITGGIDPAGHVNLTYQDNDPVDAGFVSFVGDVGADGKASGGNWRASNPLTCAKKEEAPKEGPGVTFNPVLGGLVAHINDRSGVDSQCEYRSDDYTRTFFLKANTTFDLRIVPAIPEFRDRPVSITCDNGTKTDTSTFF